LICALYEFGITDLQIILLKQFKQPDYATYNDG